MYRKFKEILVKDLLKLDTCQATLTDPCGFI